MDYVIYASDWLDADLWFDRIRREPLHTPLTNWVRPSRAVRGCEGKPP